MGYGTAVTVLQTIGVYVLIPLAVYGVLALLTLWSRVVRAPRYRPGQPWSFEPVWWTGNPHGIGSHSGSSASADAATGTALTARGGARGNW